MRKTRKLLSTFIIAAVCFAACSKDAKPLQIESETSSEDSFAGTNHGDHGEDGWVYTENNQVDANKVIAYRRNGDGTLHFTGSYSTGGKGTGSGLGSQGAVVLANDDDKILLAVNAGSNSISSFRISNHGLDLVSTISSHGTKPISITQYGKLVFVLNAGGNGNISGFLLTGHGRLINIPNSTKPLSSNASDPAQISFVNNGKVLVVTEKGTNKIISYTINLFGIPGAFHSIASASPTPFGFAVGPFGKIYVSEAAGGAKNASNVSSYQVDYNGAIHLIEGPVSAGQTAACWVVLTDNNKYVYATNTGSNTVSSFSAKTSGNIDVLNASAANSGTTPIDAALSEQSKFLYVLNAGSNSISSYTIRSNGSLNKLQTVTGLQAGGSGLAAE